LQSNVVVDGDNGSVKWLSKRAVLLTGVWLVGVGASVAVAFAAVGAVARGVEPANIVRLSGRAIDRELRTPTSPPPPAHAITPPSVPSSTSTTTAPPTSNTVGTATSVPTTGAVTPPTTAPERPTTRPTTARASSATATPSPGGTVYTHCIGPNTIAFDSAIPNNAYFRVRDVENGSGVEQWFSNGKKVSKVHAECSGGVVHAEVENERDNGGD